MPPGADSKEGGRTTKGVADGITIEVPGQQRRRPEPGDSSSMHSPTTPKSPTVSGRSPHLLATDAASNFVSSNMQEASSSRSSSLDNQPGNPEYKSDRVFPIRSVVSVDISQSPFAFPGRNSSEQQVRSPTDTTPPSAAGIHVIESRSSQQQHGQSSIAPNNRPSSRPRQQQETKSHGESQGETGIATTSSNPYSDSERYGGGRRMQLFSYAESDKSHNNVDPSIQGSIRSDSTGSRIPAEEESVSGLVTTRFKHMITAEGHAVITGRDGETLQRCEDEPIHIPGAVQGFGLLIALEEEEEGQFLVRVASENSLRMIGYSPQDLFKLNNFCDILSDEQTENLLDHVDFIQDEEADAEINGPEVFTMFIMAPKSSKRSQKLWCAMHINPAHPELIICEFELDDDQKYPLTPRMDEDTPEPPEDTLHSHPSEDQYADSTQNTSKPLRVLRSARKRKGEAAAMEVFNIMSQVQEQLASAPNLDIFLKVLVGVVKELTGFHRVMIYQFDSTFNGRVVTELVDPRATRDLYKGLNFPASDIPKQARDLYKVNKVRLLYDRDLETARLVCRTVKDLERPLDLTFSFLRAMSPIHLKYLANMAVRSSMSISINAFNDLWGLIACHSYGSKGMRVSFPIRKMCRLIGDTASRNIERLSYASRLQARKLINTIPTATNPSGYIIASSDDLLRLFDADFGLLSIHGETKVLGKPEQSQEALAMLEYLRLRKLTSVIVSQDITQDFPDLRYPPGFTLIAGLLLVPLSVGGRDFIAFFRKGQTKEVRWAGNPYEKFIKEGTESYLEPRKSFQTWSETIMGKCREWTEEQVETAAVLRLVYGKFIEVWRQKEAALQSSQLTKLLLANSAHEVRTPLNAIINYLEIALEGALDQETRENLAKSHSASKSLIYVINDLLDLTKTEAGQDLIKDEVFDLRATLLEATNSFKGDAKRKGLEYEVVEHPGLPQFVHGDQRRVRQVVANITANAIQHTADGWVRVELWLQESLEKSVTIEITVQDSGVGMSNEKVDALFRELEQVTTDGEGYDNAEEVNSLLTDGKENGTLGLGLAMVARIVWNMDGQLRLKSEEGKGSRFVIQLPFVLFEDDAHSSSDEDSSGLTKFPSHSLPIAKPPPAAADGEVTLIDKASSLRVDGISRKRSTEEFTSLRSFKSGSSNKSNKSNKSDVDRLIDAISGSLSNGNPEVGEQPLQRSNSKDSANNRKSAGSLGNVSSGARFSNSLSQPGHPSRPHSYSNSITELGSPEETPLGSEFITDNLTLLRAVKMPDEFSAASEETAPGMPSRVLFDIQNRASAPEHKPPRQDAEHLRILVAEDDPINSRIIKKRLEKSGHEIYHTINGEECATVYAEKAAFFEVILMDMQMPIVDGLSSTRMIRSFEKSHPQSKLAPRASKNGRIPIFAVSASLVERKRQAYIDAGFDGWILKPIDFKRVKTLLAGIIDDEVRNKCIYQPGKWEIGGWFHRRSPSILRTSNVTSDRTRAHNQQQQQQLESEFRPLDGGLLHSSESGSITPVIEPGQPVTDKARPAAMKPAKGEVGGQQSKDC